MNSAKAALLLDINRLFYLEHGRDFAGTRERVQPGVRRVLREIHAQDTILDLGCGSGAFARALSENGHKAPYIGLDFSPALLERACLSRYDFPVTFRQADLASQEHLRTLAQALPEGSSVEPTKIAAALWAVVTAFAVLHHMPGRTLRLSLLTHARHWLLPDGRLLLSNWQFSSNGKMKSRMLPWSAVGLSAEDVDEGDYLVDWRGGAPGVRYVHEFGESELAALAAESGFCVMETFFSDGADRRSGMYQIWRPA